MAAPLRECTTLEQRSIVRFSWAKGMESKNIHKEMLIWVVNAAGELSALGSDDAIRYKRRKYN
jgi:hypothetical protein